MPNQKIDLTYLRAVAIMKAADVVWSEFDYHAYDSEWKELIEAVKERFPKLQKKYAYL